MSRPALLRLRFVFQRLAAATTALTCGRLAEEYQVSRKTIWRDIDLLRQMGVITASNRDGFSFQGINMAGRLCPFCGLRQPHS